MAKDQISREIFDAMMQEMIGNYSGDRYDEPRRSGPSRSTPRSHRYEEDYRDNGRYHRDPPMRSPRDDYRSRGPDSRRSSYPGPHRREYEEESYHSYSDRRRSGSPSRSRDRYHSEYRDHDFGYSRSRDASWSEEPDYYQERPHRDRGLVSPRERGGYNQRGWGHSPRDEIPRGRGASQGPRGRGASQGPPGRGGFPVVRGRGSFQARGRGTTFVPRGRGTFFTTRGRRPGGAISLRGRGGRGGSSNDKAPIREQSLKALMEKADALSNFESQVIQWAGFHEVDDTEFTPKNLAHSTLETDTCINTLTSFRCFFKPELRYFCFLAVRTLNHSALKKPKIDGDFFQLLMEKGAVADKFSFSKVINPLDKHLTIFQTYLLKSAHPLLLACNEHELNLKKVSEDDAAASSAEETSALEKSISLCRKGLVLLGQTFAVVTSFRQEKILEAAGLLEAAPKPTDYPNLNDSLLFGKEYMTRLKEWLEESGHKIKVKSDQVVPEKGLKPEPKVKETLDSLLKKAINSWKDAEREKAEKEAELKKEMEKGNTEKEDGTIEDVKEEVDVKEEEQDTELETSIEKEKEVEMETEQKKPEAKPDFWFLFDEDSQEFKYYQQKLAEIQKLKREAAEAKLKAEKQKLKAAQLAAAQKAAAEVAAAEKAAAEKRAAEKAAAKEAAEKAASEKKAAQKAAAEKAAAEKADKASKEPVAKKTIVKTATPAKQKKQKKAATKALTGILKKTKGAAASSDTSDNQYSEVDDKTKETAENLARFIVQMGAGIKDFNMESLTSNPDFWFLNDEESPAYTFYQSKVTEFRESPDKSVSSETDKVESKKSDPLPKKAEAKDSKSKDKTDISESQEHEPQASEAQDIEESEDKSSQEQMECEAAESASSDGASQSATSTPARSPLTRKRGRPMRGGRGGPAKRVCQVEEPKVEEPTKVGNEKPSGRPALRKKQTKQKETLEQSTEDDGVKVGDASGDADDGDE